MNREMLKECIADAKTIRETAIASAKLALEEAFTPTLMASFAEQLNELEEEVEMEESVEETYSQEGELEENFDLEELLAELSMEEEQEPTMEGEDMKDEPLEENLMLEEMSDEEIEELVMQVIDDMIASGKLMPGEGEEEDEEEEMEDMEDMEGEEIDEEINLEELLAEMDSEKEELEEIEQWVSGYLSAPEIAGALGLVASIVGVSASDYIKSAIKKFGEKGAKEKIDKIIKDDGVNPPTQTDETTNKEMEETINELRNELNEVNLLNAKLLYTNKIFKAKNLTESEKIKVLNTFDKAETVKEVKLVFETLTESFKATTAKKNPIKESLGSASKTISTATPKQPIIEANEAFARMQRLAGLKK